MARSSEGAAVASRTSASRQRDARRLCAILAADVAGYSRLIGRDERGTITRLKALRTGLIDPAFARHGGRIVKLMGDGALVEFGSAVDAVEAAVEIQRGMAALDLDRPEEDRIRFRLGVNLGDVIVDGDDILGDGVNVAARLEGLAEPGGIASPGTSTSRCATAWPTPSRTRASGPSRTSPARSASAPSGRPRSPRCRPRLRRRGGPTQGAGPWSPPLRSPSWLPR